MYVVVCRIFPRSLALAVPACACVACWGSEPSTTRNHPQRREHLTILPARSKNVTAALEAPASEFPRSPPTPEHDSEPRAAPESG